RVRPGIEQVLADRGMEEERVLKDHANLPAQRFERQVANVEAVQPDGAKLRIVEPGQEVGDRGLAGAGRADQCGQLPWLDLEGHVRQGRAVARTVAKRDLIELDLPARLIEMDGLRL